MRLELDHGFYHSKICCLLFSPSNKVSTVKTAEQQGRPDNAVPRWVIMIEGSTPEAVRSALAGPLDAAGLAKFGLSGAAGGIYGLQLDLLGAA